MKLTESNYHSAEANRAYWSASMFKEFRECEARGLAQIRGEYERPKSEAFLEGGYVDAHFAGSMDAYLTEHPEILNSRTGALKAGYQRARAAIEVAEKSEMFMEFVSGARQTIITGKLFGAPWKAKPDFVLPDKIVDLKYMRDVLPVWKNGEKLPFIDAYGYDIQGFVYQELIYRSTGSMLPFYLAVITKEEPADLFIVHIPQWKLNSVAGVVEHYVKRFEAIKAGEIEPQRCGACSYCRETKVLEHVTEYEELLEVEE